MWVKHSSHTKQNSDGDHTVQWDTTVMVITQYSDTEQGWWSHSTMRQNSDGDHKLRWKVKIVGKVRPSFPRVAALLECGAHLLSLSAVPSPTHSRHLGRLGKFDALHGYRTGESLSSIASSLTVQWDKTVQWQYESNQTAQLDNDTNKERRRVSPVCHKKIANTEGWSTAHSQHRATRATTCKTRT